MPQLDLSNYFSQIFWTVICLSVIFFTFKHIYIPRIQDVFNKRSKRIADLIADSQKLAAEALRLQEDYDSKIKEVYIKVAKLRNEKLSEFEETCQQKLYKLQEEHDQALKENKRKISKARIEYRKLVPDEAEILFALFSKKVLSLIN